MNSPQSRLPLVFASLTVLVLAAFFGWRYHQSNQAPQAPTPIEAPVAAAPAPAGPELPAGEAIGPPPGITNPVEDIEVIEPVEPAPAPLPKLEQSDALLGERLTALLGRDKVLGFLQIDGFVRRLVATVDNLPRQRAPAAVWPVNPTPQRFTVQGPDSITTVHPDNHQRYTPLVETIEAVDTARAVAMYRSLYPMFQQAYEELGYPDRYFNDRVVQVLDHLIDTPVQGAPLAVTLVEVKGEVPSTRPWVRYEFADPALEGLSAGRKMLLRTGPENHQRLRAKLVNIRERIAKR